jgi:hypothetical protein
MATTLASLLQRFACPQRSESMRFGLPIVLLILGLTSVVGCGATPSHEVLDVTNDPSWQPPGQGDLAIGEDPEVKAKPKPRARSLQQPNHAEIPTGPLRARSVARPY